MATKIVITDCASSASLTRASIGNGSCYSRSRNTFTFSTENDVKANLGQSGVTITTDSGILPAAGGNATFTVTYYGQTARFNVTKTKIGSGSTSWTGTQSITPSNICNGTSDVSLSAGNNTSTETTEFKLSYGDASASVYQKGSGITVYNNTTGVLTVSGRTTTSSSSTFTKVLQSGQNAVVCIPPSSWLSTYAHQVTVSGGEVGGCMKYSTSGDVRISGNTGSCSSGGYGTLNITEGSDGGELYVRDEIAFLRVINNTSHDLTYYTTSSWSTSTLEKGYELKFTGSTTGITIYNSNSNQICFQPSIEGTASVYISSACTLNTCGKKIEFAGITEGTVIRLNNCPTVFKLVNNSSSTLTYRNGSAWSGDEGTINAGYYALFEPADISNLVVSSSTQCLTAEASGGNVTYSVTTSGCINGAGKKVTITGADTGSTLSISDGYSTAFTVYNMSSDAIICKYYYYDATSVAVGDKVEYNATGITSSRTVIISASTQCLLATPGGLGSVTYTTSETGNCYDNSYKKITVTSASQGSNLRIAICATNFFNIYNDTMYTLVCTIETETPTTFSIPSGVTYHINEFVASDTYVSIASENGDCLKWKTTSGTEPTNVEAVTCEEGGSASYFTSVRFNGVKQGLTVRINPKLAYYEFSPCEYVLVGKASNSSEGKIVVNGTEDMSAALINNKPVLTNTSSNTRYSVNSNGYVTQNGTQKSDTGGSSPGHLWYQIMKTSWSTDDNNAVWGYTSTSARKVRGFMGITVPSMSSARWAVGSTNCTTPPLKVTSIEYTLATIYPSYHDGKYCFESEDGSVIIPISTSS